MREYSWKIYGSRGYAYPGGDDDDCWCLVADPLPIVATLVHTCKYILVQEYGRVLYLECVTRIWVDFKEITKSKWSRRQSFDFF